MKRHCVLYVFNTYERAKFACNDKRLTLEKDGYSYSHCAAQNRIEVWLSNGELLRLDYVAVNSVNDVHRQLAGVQVFMIHFQLDGIFTGEMVDFIRSRKRGKAPESEPVRRGDLWRVINRG